MLRAAIFLLSVCLLTQAAVLDRVKRQTYHYDDALRSYAHPHQKTKVQQGYLARYAPQDWPKWYSRNIMRWDGHQRISPYDHNDSRFAAWNSDFARNAKA